MRPLASKGGRANVRSAKQQARAVGHLNLPLALAEQEVILGAMVSVQITFVNVLNEIAEACRR